MEHIDHITCIDLENLIISKNELLTATTESLAAVATMSAQETTPGHHFSSCAFMLSMTSYPLRELTLGNALCSPLKVVVSFNNTDASHPCKMQARLYKNLFKSLCEFLSFSYITFHLYRLRVQDHLMSTIVTCEISCLLIRVPRLFN